MSALYYIRNCEAVPVGAALSVRHCGKWQRAFYQELRENNRVLVMLESGGCHDMHVTMVHGVMIRSH